MQNRLIAEVKILVEREIKAEWRQRFAINGILIQLVSSAFIIYLIFQVLNPPAWNALFWIVLVFSAVNAVSKSFLQDTEGKFLYLHSLVRPDSLILAKTIYGVLILTILSSLALFVFSVLFQSPLQNFWGFVGVMLLFSSGLASLLTMVSAIASKSGNGPLLMPVLSFPILIPLLMVAVSAAKKAMDGFPFLLLYKDLGVLLLLDLMIISLSVILFGFLWKD